MNQKHYDLCYRAHYNVSFHPEKRAESYCAEFEQTQRELTALGARPETIEKSERLFIDWMHSKSNCISSMITGPARFPVRRAEKANNSEHNKMNAYYDHLENVKKAIQREQYYEAHPEARPISNSDSDAIDRLKAKLAKMEADREQNNAINKAVRRKPRAEATPEKIEELKAIGLPEQVIQKIFTPDFCGRVGIPAYVNQNLGGNIKTIRDRIGELEHTAERDTEESELNDGIKFVTDPDSMRVYFEFPGKPDADTRTILKSNGFKWTPSQSHWGRKLTSNAEYSAKRVTEALNGKATK